MRHLRTVVIAVLFTTLVCVPARAIERQVLEVDCTDVAFRAADGLLYAAIIDPPRSTSGWVIGIDPATGGAVGDGVPLLSAPSTMELADDGRTLYVALRGRSTIQVLDLETRQVTGVIDLGNDQFDQPREAEDLSAQPGSPQVLAVSLKTTAAFTSPRHRGVVIYDQGVARPVRAESHTGANRIVFSTSDPTLLCGSDNETTTPSFFRLRVNGDGVTEIDHTEGLVDFVGDLQFRDGKVYTNEGQVVDPAALTVVSFFDSPPNNTIGAVALDDARAYFMDYGMRLYEFDRPTRAPITDQPFPPEPGSVARMTRWGADGLAVAARGFEEVPGTLVILRSIHEPPVCNLSVLLTDGRDPTTQNQSLFYRIRVSNAGPQSADEVVVRNWLPANATFTDLVVRGFYLPAVDSSGVVVVPLGHINPGDTVDVHVGVVPHQIGTILDSVQVATRTAQTQGGDDNALEYTEVREPGWDFVDLWTTIVPPTDPVVAGRPFTYTVFGGNRGPSGATNAILYHQTYLLNADPISATTPVGQCDISAGTVNCIFPAVAAGESIAVEITAVGHTAFSGPLEAQIAAYDPPVTDGDPTNNQTSVTVTVSADPAAQLDALVDLVTSYGLARGVEHSLVTELEKAREAWLDGNVQAACAALASFLDLVERRSRNKLTESQARELTQGALEAQASMGCVTTARRHAPPGPPDAVGFEGTPASLALARRSGTSDRLTRIRLAMPDRARVQVDVIDVTGRIVRTLANEVRDSGYHDLVWADGAAPGIYFVVASTASERAVLRCVRLR